MEKLRGSEDRDGDTHRTVSFFSYLFMYAHEKCQTRPGFVILYMYHIACENYYIDYERNKGGRLAYYR